MKRRSRVLIAGSLLTGILLLLSVLSVPSISAQPIVSSFNLPNGESITPSVLYSGNRLYALGYETGYLYELSVPGLNLLRTIDVTGSRTTDCCSLFGMAVLNGDLWITKRFNSLPGNPLPGVGSGRIYRVNLATGAVSFVDTGRDPQLFAIVALNGFLWFTTNDGVSRLNPNTLTVTDVSGFTLNVDYIGLTPFGSNLLVTSLVEGTLYTVDTTALTATRRVTGLRSPLGIGCCTGNFAWVAEQGGEETLPSLTRVATNTFAIQRSEKTDGRTPYGVAVIQGFVVWSSSSNGIITIEAAQPILINTGKHAVYSLSSDGTSIFFSFAGSTGAGQVEGWQPKNCETKGGGTCKK